MLTVSYIIPDLRKGLNYSARPVDFSARPGVVAFANFTPTGFPLAVSKSRVADPTISTWNQLE